MWRDWARALGTGPRGLGAPPSEWGEERGTAPCPEGSQPHAWQSSRSGGRAVSQALLFVPSQVMSLNPYFSH